MVVVRGVWVAHCLFHLFGPTYYQRPFYFTRLELYAALGIAVLGIRVEHSLRSSSEVLTSLQVSSGAIRGLFRVFRSGTFCSAIRDTLECYTLVNSTLLGIWIEHNLDRPTDVKLCINHIGIIQSDIDSIVCGVSL